MSRAILIGGGARSGKSDLALRLALAEPGRDYVLDHYTWPTTLDRMALGLEDMA